MESSQSERGGPAKKRLPPDAAATQRKKETLLLARNHLKRQLEASENPRYRLMTENGLSVLDKQLADLEELERSASSP